MRNAVVGFLLKQGHVTTSADVAAVEVGGRMQAPVATVKLLPVVGQKPIVVDAQHLIAALLLYCIERRIPIPKQAEKRLELSVNGLTMVLTSDGGPGSPRLAANQVTYGEMANRATRTIGTMQEELARALARADYAESQIAQAEERAARAEAARASRRRRGRRPTPAGAAWPSWPLAGQVQTASDGRARLRPRFPAAVRNWPQAARMSRPRGVRTGEAKPGVHRRSSRTGRSPPSLLVSNAAARPGIERDQVDLGRDAGDQPHQFARLGLAVVHALQHDVFEGDPPRVGRARDSAGRPRSARRSGICG